MTASSAVISWSCCWYKKRGDSLPVSASHSSRKPSLLPLSRVRPSGEKQRAKAVLPAAKRISRLLRDGRDDSEEDDAAAVAERLVNRLNEEELTSGGSRPWNCCHCSAWDSSVSRRGRRDGHELARQRLSQMLATLLLARAAGIRLRQQQQQRMRSSAEEALLCSVCAAVTICGSKAGVLRRCSNRR